MKKQKIYSKITSMNSKSKVALLVAAALFAFSLVFSPLALATNLQERINNLSEQNSDRSEELDDLSDEATSLQDKIDKLQAKINTIQSQINKHQEEISKLENEIAKAEKELDKQKGLLGTNIRAMYLEGDISTLEMLATSKDLSDFVDKQQYRNSVQSQIRETLDKVNELKRELSEKRVTVERRLQDQKDLYAEQNAKKTENARLLSLNSNQRNQLDNEIKATSKKIEELKRQQALENLRLFGGGGGGQIGGGGYPWGYAKCLHTGQVDGPCYNYDWAVNGSPWNWKTGGYGYRNCTDWVSYRVGVATGKFVPSGLGNAKTWDDRAPAYGYTVSSTPKVGAAAVSNYGYYGHVMYVEAVNGDGSIVVSDYNRAGTGKYATNTINPNGLSFVYF
jgi:surface antigen/peptidoglycan hydrolase CwlO-like protein